MSRSIAPHYALFHLILLILISNTAWSQQEFELDNAHSSVIFSISHFKIGYIYGRFNVCSGTVMIDNNQPADSKFKFSIDSGSIDTNDKARDQHLKGPDFFNSETFPKIEFESATVTESSGTYKVTGKMKMLGQEKELTIPLQLLGVGKGPLGRIRMGMMGKFTIKRSEFGMKNMLDVIGDDVAITFSFEAVKKE